MLVSRRDLLCFAGQTALLAQNRSTSTEVTEVQDRIAQLIHAYEKQGIHRTATDVDNASGQWLEAEVRKTGLIPTREVFRINRVDPVTASVSVNGRRIEGVPLFDGAFTDASGVTGRLGPLSSDAPIGLTEAAPNTAEAGPLGEARMRNRHRAIVVITRGGRPGLCPNNAESFLKPFGPPVLQVSSGEADTLNMLAGSGSQVTLVAHVKRTRAEAFNVLAEVKGTKPGLLPLIIMTPRSGWWSCASERGGGIACWLELMRALGASKPARDVFFVASSGHELGQLGIETYVERRAALPKNSLAWIHFGANIGAAQGSGNTIQSSDDEMESMMSREITAAGLAIHRRVRRGSVPGGEAGVVRRVGGRYMSLIGSNALFHNPADRGPEAIDAGVIVRFATAFTAIAKALVAV